jgi:hypothetical protein
MTTSTPTKRKSTSPPRNPDTAEMTQFTGRLATYGFPPRMPQRTFQTREMSMVSDIVSVIARNNEVGLIDGAPGLGKTCAAIHAAQALNVPAVYLAISTNPDPNDIHRMLLTAIQGTRATGSRVSMEAQLFDLLPQWGGLIVVDEAQYLRYRGIQTLRYLHADGASRCSMLLAGWEAKKIVNKHEDLASRIAITYQFTGLDDDELVPFVRTCFPSLKKIKDTEIRQMNEIYAHGMPRAWSKAVSLCSEIEQPSFEAMTSAFLMYRGVAS